MKLDLKKIIDSMDSQTKQILQSSAHYCISRGGSEIIIEDLLHIMLEDNSSVLSKLIEHYSIKKETIMTSLQKSTNISRSESNSPVFSSSLISWLEDTYLMSKVELEQSYITEESLIINMMENISKYSRTSYYKIFEDIDLGEAKELILGKLQEDNDKQSKTQSKQSTSSNNDLEKYTTDITQLAHDGKIDPVLCRDDEIKQAIDILLRRRKNNPILVGEAGVGKTAVVEGLALKIIQKDVPIQLYNAKVLSLDLGAMQAGASIKGEFERRLQSVINSIKSSMDFIILFIDEAHTLIGAGGNEGGGDAANLLKPALARGELRTIAATTWLEYRKYFEKDPALSRRFQKINLLEPSIEDAVTILRGLAKKYEDVHNVYIEDSALQDCVKLSARYIASRQLPDKAIDVLDTACANVKISQTNKPFILQKLENEKIQIEQEIKSLQRDQDNGIKDYAKQIKNLSLTLKNINSQITKVSKEYEKQKQLVASISLLKQEGKKELAIKEYEKLKKLQHESAYIHINVTGEQIAQVVSSWTGIPLGSMIKEQSKNVLSFAEEIKARVIGQDDAIDYISTFLQISSAGLKNEHAPTGVFLLVGPSGVGKTETAKAIADLMYGGEQFLTTINMTEFQEKHSISRLIGSPPGYVGYGDGGQLTDPIRIKPYSVVLLDEIEKAHPDIMNLFYQIFDKGIVNDGEGRIIDFKNTIILLTSNLATQEITTICEQYGNVEIEPLIETVIPVLSKSLAPALIGRMNVIPYQNLSDESLMKIVELKLQNIKKQLSQKEIILKYDKGLLEYIVSLSNATDTGARNIELIINTNLMPKLSKVILDTSIENKTIKSISIKLDKNQQIKIKGE
ncbi:type VI secretion system ATPase TssH [Arcobacter sp. FWKO B]|uniref:type VI secretion system ATPase TssH n=1 Tax=Arcobacter sp. FWKO B TaxID=2593672 RepID=UPI0018A53524|nr:type VI secretion system ATPase TssH [Arcobacter sp. FWKO B]QOG13211.1 type VI secretion system ATPase TssH [Arcobacter sp. FWKO B]